MGKAVTAHEKARHESCMSGTDGGVWILTGIRSPLLVRITGRRWFLENGPVLHQWNWWKGIHQ